MHISTRDFIKVLVSTYCSRLIDRESTIPISGSQDPIVEASIQQTKFASSFLAASKTDALSEKRKRNIDVNL